MTPPPTVELLDSNVRNYPIFKLLAPDTATNVRYVSRRTQVVYVKRSRVFLHHLKLRGEIVQKLSLGVVFIFYGESSNHSALRAKKTRELPLTNGLLGTWQHTPHLISITCTGELRRQKSEWLKLPYVLVYS